MNRPIKLLLIMLLLAPCVFRSGAAQAFGGSTQEKRPLAFGTLAINGAAPQHVEIAPDGTVTSDPGITVLHKGYNGVYRLYAYDPNLAVTLSVADTTLDRVFGGSPSFDIIDFTFDPDGIGQVMDGSGEMIVKIGATLETRPATTYLPGPYRGTYTLMINF